MERLCLLASRSPSVGRVGCAQFRACHGTVLFIPALAGQPGPGLAGGAKGDPVQPVAQQVGIADRRGPAGQHQEDGLEGVFGVLAIDQKLPADAEHHRTVPSHQRGERILAGGVARA